MIPSIIAVDFALCQPIKSQGGYMGPSDPWRLEPRPKRHDQHAARRLVYCVGLTRSNSLKARGIGPMRIFEISSAPGLAVLYRLYLLSERLQRSISRRCLCGQVGASGYRPSLREQQQIGEEPLNSRSQVDVCVSRASSLSQLRLHGVLVSRTLQHVPSGQ